MYIEYSNYIEYSQVVPIRIPTEAYLILHWTYCNNKNSTHFELRTVFARTKVWEFHPLCKDKIIKNLVWFATTLRKVYCKTKFFFVKVFFSARIPLTLQCQSYQKPGLVGNYPAESLWPIWPLDRMSQVFINRGLKR